MGLLGTFMGGAAPMVVQMGAAMYAQENADKAMQNKQAESGDLKQKELAAEEAMKKRLLDYQANIESQHTGLLYQKMGEHESLKNKLEMERDAAKAKAEAEQKKKPSTKEITKKTMDESGAEVTEKYSEPIDETVKKRLTYDPATGTFK